MTRKWQRRLIDWSDPLQVRAYQREWKRTRQDKEATAAYYAKWYQLNKEKHKGNKKQELIRDWYTKNPLARAAHGLVRRALASGRLVKSKFCEHCGITDKRLVAHHPDYLEPLQVVWLCDRCHKRMHVSVQRGTGQ